jgi:hypothetical protein
MRTTLALDDEVFELVKRYAAERSLPMGKAVCELVRRGLSTPQPTRMVNGLHVAVLPPDSPSVSTEDVRKSENESE